MDSLMLDKEHDARILRIAKKAEWTPLPSDIFVSRRVFETLEQDKVILPSFRVPEVITLLPFVPNLYVLVCPTCVPQRELEKFRELTRAGLIIPILTSRYSDYPNSVVECVQGFDHMSMYEFDAYRNSVLSEDNAAFVCATCERARRNKLIQLARKSHLAERCSRTIREICDNLIPVYGVAEEVFDYLERVIRDGKGQALRRLYNASYAVRDARTAYAFKGAPLITDKELSCLPQGMDVRVDEAQAIAVRMKSLVADGLKLKVPLDIPINAYIELVRAYRPKFIELSNQLLNAATQADNNISASSLIQIVTTINRDIERISQSRRNLVLEALVSFARERPSLAVSAMISVALAMCGHPAACGAAAPVGYVADAASRRLGLRVSASEKTKRLMRRVENDLQPLLDKVIARYLGTSPTVMHVLSMRKAIAGAVGRRAQLAKNNRPARAQSRGR